MSYQNTRISLAVYTSRPSSSPPNNCLRLRFSLFADDVRDRYVCIIIIIIIIIIIMLV